MAHALAGENRIGGATLRIDALLMAERRHGDLANLKRGAASLKACNSEPLRESAAT